MMSENIGKFRLQPYQTANGMNTIEVLNSLKTEFPHQPMNLVWDGLISGTVSHKNGKCCKISTQTNILKILIQTISIKKSKRTLPKKPKCDIY